MLLCLLDRRVERDIGIALLGRPDDRLLADDAWDPHARIGLLQGQRPRIDDAVLIVRALPAERTGHGPGLHDQVVRLLEALAVVGGVHARRQLLLSAAAHEPGHEPALRDHVDHGQLLGEPDRVLGERQRIAEHHDLDALGGAGQHGCEYVGLGLHAERRVVVLVQHDAVDADLLGVDVLLEIFAIEAAARDRIEMLVGEGERGGAVFQALFRVVGRHRLLGEIHQVHAIFSRGARERRLSRAMKGVTSLASLSGCSRSTQCPQSLMTSSLAFGSAAR